MRRESCNAFLTAMFDIKEGQRGAPHKNEPERKLARDLLVEEVCCLPCAHISLLSCCELFSFITLGFFGDGPVEVRWRWRRVVANSRLHRLLRAEKGSRLDLPCSHGSSKGLWAKLDYCCRAITAPHIRSPHLHPNRHRIVFRAIWPARRGRIC